MNPLISVIIPTYNLAETIGVAINSILEQTYSNLEIIVVDDNSKDKTKDIVERFQKKIAGLDIMLYPMMIHIDLIDEVKISLVNLIHHP